MSLKSHDQVELSDLLFGMNWEDPESDRRALAIQPGDTLTTISSGGCNTLTLLLEDPGKIYAVDINPSQGYLLELKRAAARHLDYDELRAFLGMVESDRRPETFRRLSPGLSEPALAYWRAKPDAIERGVIYAGKYESFIRLFSRTVALMQGRKRVEGFFRCETLEQQRRYFDERWNTFQWRLLFRILINKRMLARRGLTADYFKFDDGATSFADSFFRRTRNAMREIPVATNYFLAQYLLGRYLTEEAVPAWLRRENLPIVKARLDRIEIATSDSQAWLAQRPAASIDAFALSNICELMSLEQTGRLFAEVARTARPNARICFRNLMVPREVPARWMGEIELQTELSRDLIARDRSFVYSRVQAFIVRKGPVTATS